MQLALTKNNNLVISNLQAEGKPDVTPKVLVVFFFKVLLSFRS
jgi:hypothetical protein